MLQSIASRKSDVKKRSGKGARRHRPPNAIVLAVRDFAKELGLDFDKLKDSERGALFERFATFHILRRFHEQELEPRLVDEMLSQNAPDASVSCVIAILNGQVLEDDEAIDRAIADGTGFVSLSIVAITASRANRFDPDKLEEFVDGSADILEAMGAPVTEASRQSGVTAVGVDSALLERIGKLRGATEDSGQKLLISVYGYYAALANWSDATTPAEALLRGRRRVKAIDWLGDSSVLVKEVEFEAVDRGRILDLMATGMPLHSLPDSLPNSVDLEDYDANLPSAGLIALPAIKGVESGFSGHVPVGAFIKLLEREDGQGMREGIFTQNVRGYQGDGGVNERIRDTLAGRDRAQFLLRNNGVTVVADEVERDGEDVVLTNFQIVNGLQTSTVIYRIRHELRGARDVHVPVKLVASADPTTRRAIIDATNRQTPITGAALCAVCEKAIGIERHFFARLRAGGPAMVLERRPGQYAKSLPADRVSLEEVLRAFYGVFLESPHIAERGFAAIAHDLDDGLLAPSLTAEPYYVAARLVQFVRDVARLRDEPRLAQIEHHAALGLRLMCMPTKPPLGEAGQMRSYCREIEMRMNAEGMRDIFAQRLLDITQSPRDRMRSRVQGVPQLKRTRDDIVRRALEVSAHDEI